MTYIDRGSGGSFGTGAGVDLQGGPGLSPKVKFPLIYQPSITILAPAASKNYTLWQGQASPSSATVLLPLGSQFQVLEFAVTLDVASTNTLIMIEKCTSGTASGSGVNLINTTINTNSAPAASTPLFIGPNTATVTLATNLDSLFLNATDRINVYTGSGTAGSIANLCITAYLARTGD